MSSASSGRVALLCGAGHYPVLAAAEMLRQGFDLVAVAPAGETDPELRQSRIPLREFPFFRLARLLEILREEGASRAVLMGKLHKVRIYGPLELDDLARSIYLRLSDHRDDTILAAVVAVLAEHGVTVDPAPRYLQNWMAPAALMNGIPLSDREAEDVRFGFTMAKGIGALDLGQTVIVKDRAVVAVESVEGTDQAILRAGHLAGPGTVVVKTAKPDQDFRFDVPGVGIETLRYMEAARARVLAVEAGKVMLFEREKTTALAAALGVSLIGTGPDGA